MSEANYSGIRGLIYLVEAYIGCAKGGMGWKVMTHLPTLSEEAMTAF